MDTLCVYMFVMSILLFSAVMKTCHMKKIYITKSTYKKATISVPWVTYNKRHKNILLSSICGWLVIQ